MTNKSNIRWLIIHHSASSRDKTTYNMVKAWHKKAFGINGIGYDYLITHNKLYKGLGNAHTKGYNNTGIGICLTGNFQHEKPNTYQLRTLKQLVQKYSKQKLKLVGHRDLNNTACPGDNLYKLLPQLLNKKTMKIKNYWKYVVPSMKDLGFGSKLKTVKTWTVEQWLKHLPKWSKDKRKDINVLKAKIEKLERENRGLRNNKTIELSEESVGQIVKAIIEKIRTIF